MENYWYLVIGIAIGWLTKIPFFFRYYKEIKRNKESIRRGVETVAEMIRQSKEPNNKPDVQVCDATGDAMKTKS